MGMAVANPPGLIPEATVREVTDRVDMVALVSETVRLRRSGASWKGLCPFHAEKTPSFHVNPQNRMYYCYGCGAGGDAISFVRQIRGLSFVEAVELLAEQTGVRIEREQLSPEEASRRSQARSRRARLLDLNQAAQAFLAAQLEREAGRPVREYLRQRRLGPETVERFEVGAAGAEWDSLSLHLLRQGFGAEEIADVGLGLPRRTGQGLYDRFRERLMYPIRSAAGDLVGFGGRTIRSDEQAKYMNSPESELYKKSREVFGLFRAREGIRRRGLAVLVEGNLDVMTLHQEGETAAVCPMGTALTEDQLREIRRFTERLVLVFDGDEAGRKASARAVPLCVAAGFDGRLVSLPDGEDPDSFVRRHGLAVWQRLVEEAPALVTGWLDALASRWDGTNNGRAAILRQALPVLRRLPDPIARDLALDGLSVRLAEPSLRQRVLEQGALAGLIGLQQEEGGERTERAVIAEPFSGPEAGFCRVLADRPDLGPLIDLHLAEIEQACQVSTALEPDLRAAIRSLARAVAEGEQATDDHVRRQWLHDLPEGRVRRELIATMVTGGGGNEQDVQIEDVVRQLLATVERRTLQALVRGVIRTTPAREPEQSGQNLAQVFAAARRIESLLPPAAARVEPEAASRAATSARGS